ncbi:hypothetical protein [Actinomadura rifamycini]|uniref:hypothetical protein n=1 Tax=Actinomadura rifamycini TaxID=31962 RepID=UPI00040E5CD3|nr:hypothetical protein [Actinomadura rifamycini]
MTESPAPLTLIGGTAAADAADLELLHRQARRHRIVRGGLAAGFALISTALAAPGIAAAPPWLLAAVLLVVLAVVGAVRLVQEAAHWLRARYLPVVPGPWRVWRWRIVRRWYAPGAVVWRARGADVAPLHAGPLSVLGWHHDPACRERWVLVYDGTPLMSGGGALWLPLTGLTSTPPASRTGAGGGR